MGVQVESVDDAIAYGREVIGNRIGGDTGIVVEERLVGEEFTLQAFVEGQTLVPMPLVQDYKRAFEGDQGPNTGSMGSYSREDHMLPFLTEADREEALRLMRGLIDALREEGITYQGIIYGQFMATTRGPRLVEINARFGDPEACNVLPLLETSLLDVSLAITQKRLHELDVRFAHCATVCKYVTPAGYPDTPRADTPLRLNEAAIKDFGVRVYFARVTERDGAYLTGTSRAFALVGVADTIAEAEASVEQALRYVEGTYHVRHDIGKKHLVERSLRAPALAGAPAA
jgi:phosphoribosylamine--glycine ligase